jgi:hypothetical protein
VLKKSASGVPSVPRFIQRGVNLRGSTYYGSYSDSSGWAG